MNLKKMAATVAKPGLIPRVVQELQAHNLPTLSHTDTDNAPQEDVEPKVPPQHQQLKLTDFALVRTLGTGIYSPNIYAQSVLIVVLNILCPRHLC